MGQDLFDTNNLIKQFLCCTPLNTMDLLGSTKNIGCFFDLNRQKEILENTVNNDLVKKYPVKRSYQQAFLKLLMKKIEERDGEIHDEIYAAYCNLISLSLNEVIHYKHFLIDDQDSDYISIQESTNIISEGTTGLCSWQGAVELSKWCIENKSEFCGKVILELGCGVGLTGLSIIKKCSPKQYVFTDCHRTVLEMVSANIKFNLQKNKETVQIKPQLKTDRLKFQMRYNNTNVEVMELRWEDIKKYLTENWTVPDVIIGADILYETNSFSALVVGLKALLSFNNRYGIIAATIRNMDTFSLFLHQLGILLTSRNNLLFECRNRVRDKNIQVLKNGKDLYYSL
ncbi:protein-lysine N-methyltransferase EEF2KMT isoform X1 [Hylaeus volcanicus]|uniref:protein-lysine N-methyltransferase EEF2KMT isoform X1 n=1 Tax=Hylaeus volcanicus TaxID=313075 RepID=UPI0023B795A9|nr:protein-lysine N-methyltransferase EEF2KMT isoform X1 [Hylaeus volcanicus]XP_053976786.1 protein-lysine N-methyltransferase EEF2KMT isoform X1 [Hylaeus volcanicus]XP_053976787.1 protein-lysine N-methyltransferase EEF2KMT isoform X1 [Hylaeus volcanicus]XP_053976788.1 protein-lysine N-methyltransferase EEF2KMT isoform X1 [Hylaeus volcanicus]XP_053976790.1 protein-lysine N-methyltransferase EEF2KMT isoform X1 [Hylaeus volcanicus]XP_053976791.1 protein-lysine N-methyltransferase EEF2KMT isoform